MGLFDDAVPGGNIAKPLLIALGALLAGKMFAGGGREPDRDADEDRRRLPQGGQDRARHQEDNGGILGGGLGDLLDRLRQQGQGKTADSWVKPDARNEPIGSDDLGRAIGPQMLDELARRTGIPKEQLLEQLSKALPGVVDKLTPDGRVPSSDQIAGQLNNPWAPRS